MPYSRLCFLLLSLVCFVVVGCPPGSGDDDDSAAGDDDDDAPVGEPPVVADVELCEMPNSNDDCAEGAGPGVFQLAFDVTMTDEDGDLNNPVYFLIIDAPPAVNGFLEANLGEGGMVRIRMCSEWVRGASFDYELWVRDAAGNDSERFVDSYTVPAEGADDCAPL